jgi:hypothetical protein
VLAITGTSLTVTTGNITGGNLILSGAIIDSAQLDIQTSAANANIVFTPNGTGNVNTGANLSVTGRVTAASVVGGVMTGSSVSVTGAVTGASVVGGVITGSSTSVTGTVTGASVVGGVMTGSSISVSGAVTGAGITGSSLTVTTGNITAGNLLVSGAIIDSAQLDIQTSAANANIVLTPNGSGNVNISANIMPTANGISNIGNATLSYNTVFAKATSAQYADLAENYSADAEYAPGTVLIFGGNNEVTISCVVADARVAGVISTNPAHLMNSTLAAKHVAAVALTGRVPTKVVGTIRKGDMMVTAGNGYAQASAAPAMGTVIGKALENFDGESGTIEIVVGRL